MKKIKIDFLESKEDGQPVFASIYWSIFSVLNYKVLHCLYLAQACLDLPLKRRAGVITILEMSKLRLINYLSILQLQ